MNIIRTRKELKEWLAYEKPLYGVTWFEYLTKSEMYYCWKYVKLLRKCEYYRNCKYHKLLLPVYLLYRRRKNKLSMKIGVKLGDNSIGKGLTIYHSGYIIINGIARIGENFKLHGCNCIGNDGVSQEVPIIGNNVEMGFGSCIIGGVKIADNVKIGANATVVEDCLIPGATIVGTKGRAIKAQSNE